MASATVTSSVFDSEDNDHLINTETSDDENAPAYCFMEKGLRYPQILHAMTLIAKLNLMMT